MACVYLQVHAEKTEEFLNGKCLDNEKDFQAALQILEGELNPEFGLMSPDEEYLKSVAQGLLYKVL